MVNDGEDKYIDYQEVSTQKTRDTDIITIFESTDETFLSTSEVAEQLPIGKRATLNRLNRLHTDGKIEKKKIGVGCTWWLPSEDESISPPDDLSARLSLILGETTVDRMFYGSVLGVLFSVTFTIIVILVDLLLIDVGIIGFIPMPLLLLSGFVFVMVSGVRVSLRVWNEVTSQ
jgi:hypothetical protein